MNRDHAGGNDQLKKKVVGIKVYGGSLDNVTGCNHKVENGDKMSLGANVNILCLHTPWYVYLPCFLQYFLISVIQCLCFWKESTLILPMHVF